MSPSSSPLSGRGVYRAPRALAVLVLLSVGAGLACKRGRGGLGPGDAPAAHRVVDRAALVTLPHEDDLARSETWLPAPRPVTRVIVSPTGIRLDNAALVDAWPASSRTRFVATLGPARAEALPREYPDLVPIQGGRVSPHHKRGGAHGFVILPLQQRLHDLMDIERGYARLTGASAGGAVNLYVDAATPSRTLFEVLYTLGMEQYSAPRLVVRGGGREGVVPMDLPTGRGADEEAPAVTLKILPGGYMVGTGEGFVAPGCTTLGPASLTVGNLPAPGSPAGVYDHAGLTRCMQALRTTWPATRQGHGIHVSPNAEIPYGVLMATLAAVRGSEPGACTLAEEPTARRYDRPECLFPDVVLGILR